DLAIYRRRLRHPDDGQYCGSRDSFRPGTDKISPVAESVVSAERASAEQSRRTVFRADPARREYDIPVSRPARLYFLVGGIKLEGARGGHSSIFTRATSAVPPFPSGWKISASPSATPVA